MPSAPHASPLGAFIRGRLERLAMSPTELAAATGLGRSTAYRLIADEVPPDVAPQQLRRLAEVLGASVDDLLDLWTGRVSEVSSIDELGAIVHGFVSHQGDLSPVELRAALEVAALAVKMARSGRTEVDRP